MKIIETVVYDWDAGEDMPARPAYGRTIPEPCNHEVGYCTGYCEHANVWRSAMQAR